MDADSYVFSGKITNIIDALATRYSAFLPQSSPFDREDLAQEGKIAFWNALRRKRVRSDSPGKLSTLAFAVAKNRMISILRSESVRAKRRAADAGTDQAEQNRGKYKITPEHNLMINEALAAIQIISPELVKMVTEGVPDELLAEARRNNRLVQTARRGKVINGKIKITPKMIERFFDINLSKLKAKAYNRM